ncbi:MAG: diguanylate cyclase [Lachnospiraceae bacterium]|nr:diguanylate cyclase [Lachnospiraceae bacterium]
MWGLCLCVCMLFFIGMEAGAKENRGRILFIGSYSYGWDTTQMQIEGIKSVVGTDYEIDYEFMDTKRVFDDVSYQNFYTGLKYRLSKVEPYDVVIVGDDTALQFMLNYQSELFAGVPIVFEGINNLQLAYKVGEDSLICGVVEELSYEDNIELALQLIPNATKVVAIIDSSDTGNAERKNYYDCQEAFPELTFSELNSMKLYTYELQRALREMTPDTIVLYITMTEDANGKKYSSGESAPFIHEYCSVPVFRMVEAGIGDGFIGGNVVSMSKSGSIAAKMAVSIIEGTVWPVDVESSPNVVCLDENILREFNIDLDLIPEDAVVINHRISFVEQYYVVLVPLGFLIAGLLGIVAVVLCNNRKFRKLLVQLGEAKNIVENASQHDFLTGLGNRSKFVADLEQLIAEQIPCTVIMLDIDDFKKINDNFGHSAGDVALQTVANRMKELHSPILTSYRYAGDEFIMILQSAQSKIVEKTAYACRNIFSKGFMVNGEEHRITGSIGISSYPTDAQNAEALVVCADRAMYQVKRSGKNQFAIYDESMAGLQEEDV